MRRNKTFGRFAKIAIDEDLRLVREMGVDTASEAKLVYPNPGSQSDLLFNVLGLRRGGEVKTVRYPERSIRAIEGILAKEGLSVNYPEVLESAVEQYPIDIRGGMKPRARTLLYRAGNGAGKSTMGATLCYLMSVMYPNAIGLISANTYDQLRDSTLVSLIRFLLAHNIPFSPWKGDIPATVRSIESRKGVEINGCWHFVRSAENFAGGEGAAQSGRGLEVSHVWGDEWLRMPDDVAFNTVLTRARLPGIPTIILLTSTINTSNPYNWGWQKFDDPDRSEEMKERFVSIAGSSIENRHNLSETYVEDMYLSMTRELFRIEVMGDYVATTMGKVYKYFDRTRHLKKLDWVEDAPKFISVDFNWSPACGIVGQVVKKVVDGHHVSEMQVIKEFYLMNSDTFSLSHVIAEYLVANDIRSISVFGDASGTQRTANSQKTNWQIVFEKLKQVGIKAKPGIPKKNPSIIDSVNALNVAFMNDRTVLDESCKELTKDFESIEWRNNDLDKRDILRTHLQDCHRYAVWQVYPLLKPSPVKTGEYNR